MLTWFLPEGRRTAVERGADDDDDDEVDGGVEEVEEEGVEEEDGVDDDEAGVEDADEAAAGDRISSRPADPGGTGKDSGLWNPLVVSFLLLAEVEAAELVVVAAAVHPAEEWTGLLLTWEESEDETEAGPLKWEAGAGEPMW